MEYVDKNYVNSNTTLVKVKCIINDYISFFMADSNTTLVKVKFCCLPKFIKAVSIQIQLLLKLNEVYH